MTKYKKGDQVVVAVHGAGVTSYEDHEVWKVSKGQVFLVDLDFPFDAESGEYLGDTFFGFRFTLLPVGEKKG